MTALLDTTQVWVADDAGRRVSAKVATEGRVATIAFTIPCGSVTGAVRRTLVRRVFALPAVRTCRAVRVSVPLGDAELLDQLRHVLPQAETRAAGATCLIDAHLTLDGGTP